MSNDQTKEPAAANAAPAKRDTVPFASLLRAINPSNRKEEKKS